MKAKLVNEKPTKGQFIQLHHYNGEIWSSTYKWIDGVLKIYSDGLDQFVQPESQDNKETKYKYLVKS